MRFEYEKENNGSSSGRILLRYLRGIIWQSALLSILFSAPRYLFHRRHFHQEDVWITFVLFILCLSVITILRFLMEAGKNRKPARNSHEEKSIAGKPISDTLPGHTSEFSDLLLETCG